MIEIKRIEGFEDYGTKTNPIPGQQPIKEYIKEHNLNVSFSFLLRNGRSRGFKLHTLN